MPFPKADLVLTGGRVFCGLGVPRAEAVALWCGRVLATGTAGEIEPLIGPATKVVRLNGRAALPGFNDAHQHMMSLGRVLGQVNLRAEQVRTLDELLRRIKERAAKAKPGEWVLGRGYDHFELDVGRHPLREELDLVAPHNPVYIKRTCGHMGVANSAALRLLGVDERTPDPPGGHIESQNGKLTGLLQERAQEIVAKALPKASQEELIQAIEAGGGLCLSQGIASVTDPAVGLVQGFDDHLAYQEAKRTGRLPVRMYECFLGGPAGIGERVFGEELRTGLGDDELRAGPMKLFADGSAGGRTAWMSEGYQGEPENFGIPIHSDGEMAEMVEDYHRRGYQIATHAIGDAAIEQVLSAYERALERWPAADRRHRIEHCGFTSDGQIARMAARGILPVPQSVFVYEFGDLYVDVLGEERAAGAYPMRRWWSAGLRPSGSSDAPVSDSHPLKNMYAAVTRTTVKGTVIGGQEALTLEEAVASQTHYSAFTTFAEDRKGLLAPGYLGDVTVVDRDIFAREPAELLEAKVDLTIVGGEVRHDRLGETG